MAAFFININIMTNLMLCDNFLLKNVWYPDFNSRIIDKLLCPLKQKLAIL